VSGRERHPAALLTTEAFNASTVDPSTVRFGPDGASINREPRVEDVDGDGDYDMSLRFKVSETGMTCSDTAMSLTGKTIDGIDFMGTDSLVTTGCR